MVEMKLRCECCDQVANEETAPAFKRIFVGSITHLPDEKNPEPIDRSKRPEYLDMCGYCYKRLGELFDNESVMQKGQVK